MWPMLTNDNAKVELQHYNLNSANIKSTYFDAKPSIITADRFSAYVYGILLRLAFTLLLSFSMLKFVIDYQMKASTYSKRVDEILKA